MNLNKRIEALETLHAPKRELPAAWVATVKLDGTVRASHVRHGKHEFDDIDEFEAFRKEKGFIERDYIQVIIVDANNCQGPPPQEL